MAPCSGAFFAPIGKARAKGDANGKPGTARNLKSRKTMRVTDLMTQQPVTLRASDTLDLVNNVMHLGRIRHMPVVSNGRLVGILSQRDLFRATTSSLLQFPRSAEQRWLAEIPVEAVMTQPVFTIAPEASIRDAVALMLRKRIGCLPVVTDGKIVGLLSETDCLQYLAHVLDISQAKDDLPELDAKI
jgi:CBS domain-containing protein